jgi:hypothetical protein
MPAGRMELTAAHLERLFRRLKAFRRTFIRDDKPDGIFRPFVTFTLLWLALK